MQMNNILPEEMFTQYERDMVRFIVGYIPFKLFSKYEKKECLSHMKVRQSEESLANYACHCLA